MRKRDHTFVAFVLLSFVAAAASNWAGCTSDGPGLQRSTMAADGYPLVMLGNLNLVRLPLAPLISCQCGLGGGTEHQSCLRHPSLLKSRVEERRDHVTHLVVSGCSRFLEFGADSARHRQSVLVIQGPNRHSVGRSRIEPSRSSDPMRFRFTWTGYVPVMHLSHTRYSAG